MNAALSPFEPWLALWTLVPDGEPFHMGLTGSRLLPVRQGDTPAMLKLAASEDERRGSEIMAWWGGQGAAPVLAWSDEALLMLRGQSRSPADLAREGRDEAATMILCDTVAALHRPRPSPPKARPLEELFAALLGAGEPRLQAAKTTAAELIATQSDQRLMHGDVHHDNVLDFGPLGWLAIDPWGIVGERAYDYANVFRNPDLDHITPERFQIRIGQISDHAGLDPERLTLWAYAHSGLSAAWAAQDGADAEATKSLAVLSIIEGLS